MNVMSHDSQGGLEAGNGGDGMRHLKSPWVSLASRGTLAGKSPSPVLEKIKQANVGKHYHSQISQPTFHRCNVSEAMPCAPLRASTWTPGQPARNRRAGWHLEGLALPNVGGWTPASSNMLSSQ